MSGTDPPWEPKVSPQLSARIHWSLGRCSVTDEVEAGVIGAKLVNAIDTEIRNAFNRGMTVIREISVRNEGQQAND